MSDALAKSCPIVPPGIVVRKTSLRKKSVDLEAVLRDLGHTGSPEESADFVSISPLFGSEAVANHITAFEQHGLVYVDDFYAVEIDLPEWLLLRLAGS